MLAAGYRPMSEDEFAERATRCKDGEKLRIARNDAQMTHACLIPWAALEALSERENAITGEPVDYKAMDRNNVLAMTRLIQSDRG